MMYPLALVCALHAGVTAAGDDGAVGVAEAARGTVSGFADDIADAVEERARVEGMSGGVRLMLDEIRGLDANKVRAALFPRVRRALRNSGGPLIQVVATVAISEERGQLWAVVVLEGESLAGPSTVVVTHPIDRELEVALGAVGASIPGRFVLERMGALPQPKLDKGDGRTERRLERHCLVLDVVMVDFDGDPSQELAVLSTCGVSV